MLDLKKLFDKILTKLSDLQNNFNNYYTKTQMDSSLGLKVNKAGDTITGALTVNNKIEINPNTGSYQEGIRIHAYSNWSDITLCGSDNTATSGTSTNTWFIGNNNGNFHLARNGSSAADITNFSSISNNFWRLKSNMAGNIPTTTRSVLHIYGPTYGNTASDLLSGTTGVFRYGDGGPQITFDTASTPGGAQAGALIFTDHDNAGTGVSWHFVTNQDDNDNGGNAIVTAPRFRARTGITIGQNTDNTTYALYINGITATPVISGGSWIAGTKNATFRVTNFTTAAANAFYQAAYSLKCYTGAWSIGALSGSNNLYFVFGTDANYNANNNSVTNACVTAAGAFTNSSKREFKENIKPINYSCCDILNSVNICSFNMKSDPNKDYRVGFIADDTDPILSGKNQDVMDLQNCIGVLIKANQELSAQVQNLKEEIQKLK